MPAQLCASVSTAGAAQPWSEHFQNRDSEAFHLTDKGPKSLTLLKALDTNFVNKGKTDFFIPQLCYSNDIFQNKKYVLILFFFSFSRIQHVACISFYFKITVSPYT